MAVLKCMNGNLKTSAYDIHRTSPWFLTILDPYDSHYHTLFIRLHSKVSIWTFIIHSILQTID